MGEIRWGTSSWSHASWEGVFYPPGTKPAEYLGHYAGHGPATIRQLRELTEGGAADRLGRGPAPGPAAP